MLFIGLWMLDAADLEVENVDDVSTLLKIVCGSLNVLTAVLIPLTCLCSHNPDEVYEAENAKTNRVHSSAAFGKEGML